MSQNRLPPPGPEACLVRLRPSTQKGGTIIAEDVTDRATHDGRICDRDGYRPPFCPTCGERRLHVHDYRERVLHLRNERLGDALARLAAAGHISRHGDSWIRLAVPVPGLIDTRRNGNGNAAGANG